MKSLPLALLVSAIATSCTLVKTGVLPRVVPYNSAETKAQRAHDKFQEWERERPITNGMTQAQIDAIYEEANRRLEGGATHD